MELLNGEPVLAFEGAPLDVQGDLAISVVAFDVDGIARLSYARALGLARRKLLTGCRN